LRDDAGAGAGRAKVAATLPRVNDFAAALLFALARLFGRLPLAWTRRIAAAIAQLWLRLDARESRVARRNLELAYPQLDAAERAHWQYLILRNTARQTLETLRFWTRPHAENLALIREVHGQALFDTALAGGHGLIVAAPHFGHWELLNQWLAAHTPLAILYRPPESGVGEAFLRRARAASGDRIEQVRAEGPAVRQLFKRLQDGGVVGILPDQQPKAGDGEFAPFFGLPALTMTLLPRLAARTGAPVLFAWCERIGDSAAFALHFAAAPLELAAADPNVGVHALNAAVERIARRDPAQYQWTYKRYTLRPSGRGEDNPYRDIERRRD
jgi:KDO2-lipid IV(A) lauroyltransferase